MKRVGYCAKLQQLEEKQFLGDPKTFLGEDIYNRIASLHDIIGLDFFGVDFTVTEKGDVLIYELDPLRN